MRRMRFKAWHTEEKMMYYDPLINGLTGEVCIYDQGKITGVYDIDTVIPLQWTGLEDKNGREIYEGDIVKERDLLAVCSWISEVAAFSFVPAEIFPQSDWITLFEEHSTDAFFRNDTPSSFVEVIGNIYENPELLESELESEGE